MMGDMSEQARSRRVLGAVAIVLVVLLAFAAGVATERMRFDAQRGDLLKRWDSALKAHQKQIMQSEKDSR
jgi:Tfp pilus assembly protein PilN